MTGPDHYRAAEEHLVVARKAEIGSNGERYNLAAAQVHATLALAAATALNGTEPDRAAWRDAAGVTSWMTS